MTSLVFPTYVREQILEQHAEAGTDCFAERWTRPCPTARSVTSRSGWPRAVSWNSASGSGRIWSSRRMRSGPCSLSGFLGPRADSRAGHRARAARPRSRRAAGEGRGAREHRPSPAGRRQTSGRFVEGHGRRRGWSFARQPLRRVPHNRTTLNPKKGRDMNTTAIMTREVVVVSPTVTVGAAVRMMDRLNIRHLPVVEGRRLAGIFSDPRSRQTWERGGLRESDDCLAGDVFAGIVRRPCRAANAGIKDRLDSNREPGRDADWPRHFDRSPWPVGGSRTGEEGAVPLSAAECRVGERGTRAQRRLSACGSARG